MAAQTTAGATLYIGTTAATGSTDTFTEVGEVLTVGKFGRVYEVINYKPLKNRGVQKFKGSYDEGNPVVTMGKDINDAGQAKVLVARDSDFDYNFKLVDNDDVAPESFAVTISNASPGVLTKVAHGLVAGVAFQLATSGALPTGFAVLTTYYVKTVLDADTFTASATNGGSVINTSSAGSGTHTLTTVPAGSYQLFKAKVMSYDDGERTADAVLTKEMQLAIKSGSLSEQVHLP